MRFDHAGVATADLDSLLEFYTELLDVTVAHEETIDGLRVAFLDLGNGYVELLEPVGEDNAIASYLDRNGPGIHHLAMGTVDLAGALDRAREMGVELIDEEPREGAWGHDVAFLHPKSTGGVLVEFVGRSRE
ncbi:methylmalonyl-CoA epimerase [Halapricum sp. CBA1109]|uniref:methylmalonyl-CoA epimerase n=1 Tax=Halapricum sp. CBA1109 TaxID=2668068 RepID=UPI0012FAA7C0|nr:methylmalonyl-CoA epimerase [Halapricum sp. CBA1109]MUV89700.1 methylmalonyl-CoA epimerase [Halapricum sp. CBA1109]